MPEDHRPVRRPVTHYCVTCGKEACWGVGVSLLKMKPGRWYCFEHRPLEPEPIPELPPGVKRDLFGKPIT